MATKKEVPNKLPLKSKDLTAENIGKINSLFPNLITEKEDSEGKLIKTIDLEKLKELVGDFADENSEVYSLGWVGKSASRRKIAESINKTLRPAVQESVDFEKTKNVFIEGDNFEVLKLLRESYLNSVKMIYIDPPYNTGKDFVYKDNFTKSREEYDVESKAVDEGGNKLFKNTATNGRFHSDWLSMMYERLTIARDLLKDDGVIFISIDDNEVSNLRKICDEIFGEGNFVANIVWQNKEGGGGSDSKLFKIKHEYVLVYSKSIQNTKIFGAEVDNEERYTESDEYVKTRGKHLLIKLESASLGYIKTLDYPVEAPDGSLIHPNKDNQKIKRWRWSKKKLDWGMNNGYVVIKKDSQGDWGVYTKQYLNADNEGNIVERTKAPLAVIDKYSTTQSAKNLAKLFDKKIFDYPKPLEYVKWFIERISKEETSNDIILDFFAGSGTTAHAVMQLNAEDGGNRRFVMVQLPEETDKDSEAYKAGYKTIAEISKERIRRAGKKIQEDNKKSKEPRDLSNVDFGFKVFKLDSSNMKDVYYNPSAIDQRTLSNFKDNIKEDRTPEDLLYQVLLDIAIPLDAKVNIEKIKGKKLFVVKNPADEAWLVACFEEGVDLDLIKEIAELKPLKAVFRDSSFKSDKDKVNTEEYLNNKSPNTQLGVI